MVAGVSDPVLQPATEPLKLSSFRQNLIRLEETIIFALIERAQFPLNVAVTNGTIQVGGRSLMDHMLRENECSHGQVRRYTSPDENPFFLEAKDVTPVMPLLDFPATIKPNKINFNNKIKSIYLEKILPKITTGEDKRSYGSTCVADIACLQALSKRIHYGKFIAEAKFQAKQELYTDLIKNNDAAGLMALLTDMPQEERVLDRVEKKAGTYGQDLDNADGPPEFKVDPKYIRELYRDIVMPETKEVQVEYLLQRISHTSVVCCGPDGSLAHQAAQVHFKLPAQNLFLLAPDRADLVFSKVLSNEAAKGVVVVETQRDGVQKKVKQLLVQFNLKIVDEIIIDGGDAGQTRCLVISKDSSSSSGRDKTCIAFGTSHESGALHSALGAFHSHGVNLSSIESLPSSDVSEGFKYDFIVECEGSCDDAKVNEALKALEKSATFVQNLGTFPQRSQDSAAKRAKTNSS